MGRSPQRAARLYFRTTCFPGEDAHGPGSCEHRGPRAGRTGESFTKWRRESWRLTNWPGSKPVTTNGSAEGSGRAIARSICGASAATSNFSGNVTCDLSNFPCVETSYDRGSGHRHCFSLSSSSCRSFKSRCTTSCGTTVARANRGLATNVFRCLASCASLFTAQHQLRFQHAVVSFSVPSSPYQRRSLIRCIAAYRFRRSA